MKPKEIQELLDFISNSGLAEVNIETEQFKISVKKHAEVQARYLEPVVTQQILAPQPSVAPTPAPATLAPAAPKTEKAAEPAKESNYITIKSPMIGTFYRSSSPESPFFVNIGDEVTPGKPVCIIEAMKLFNEIESEVSGRVVKVLVENSSPVEYDQPLFLIEPK